MGTPALSSITMPGTVTRDCPAGLGRLFADVFGKTRAGVNYPSPCLMGSCFNRQLVEDLGRLFGTELMHYGINGIYAPGAGIHRAAYSGRSWEYYSEDGYLSGEMLAAECKGITGAGCITYAKHIGFNDQEGDRNGVTVWSNEQPLREIYLAAYEKSCVTNSTNALVDFNGGEEGHEHQAWKCYQKTEIAEVDVLQGKNTLVLTFLGNGSNLKNIVLDFGGQQPLPDATVNGIEIDTTNVQTNFALEERFNGKGLVVTKTFTDNTTEVILDGYKVSVVDTATAGKKTVTVTWDKYSKTYEINVADEAKLLLDTDHYFGGSAVNTILDVYVNGVQMNMDDVMFATPADGHEHTEWHCNTSTLLGKTQFATDKVNVVELRFKADATNLFGITVDYSADEVKPATKSYVFDAEKAFLSGCMTEYTTSARYAYCGGTCPDAWHHAIEVKLGEIQLKADNTIVIEFLTDNDSNFNGIGITTDCEVVAK